MRILIIVFITISIVSCTKENPVPEPEIYNGFGSAKINGEVFNLSPRMTPSHGNDSTYNFRIDYLINDGILRKKLKFSYVRLNLETQPLVQVNFNNKQDLQCSYATRIGDGDVAGNYYWLVEIDEVEDYLQLISFDESTGDVEGEFQASFIIDTNAIVDINSPDTIVITDGYFETTIIE